MTAPSPAAAAAETPILQVEGLRVQQSRSRGGGIVVDGLELSVERGRSLGIVGESGCGKSVTALSILRLLPRGELEVVDGTVRFEGKDLLRSSRRELRSVRGPGIGMIFQDPMTSLNPVLRIGLQIAETIRAHTRVTMGAALKRAEELLEEVRMPRAHAILSAYPHELSGGMRQRVMIAVAISCDPKLLIADEPTTALDVTVQADVLDLLNELTRGRGMALVMITHDLGVLAQIADDTLVMYAGEVVERAATADLLVRPEHPYTEALLGARPDPAATSIRTLPLVAIDGHPPIPGLMPAGCRFAPRCPHRELGRCAEVHPILREVRSNHWVRSLHGRSDRDPANADGSDGRR